jgi:hypothetical protein
MLPGTGNHPPVFLCTDFITILQGETFTQVLFGYMGDFLQTGSNLFVAQAQPIDRFVVIVQDLGEPPTV